MSRHWAHFGESTFVAGIWFLYGVYRAFGRWPFRCLLLPTVTWYWMARGAARRASRQYLQRLHDAHRVFPAHPGWSNGLRHFLRFGDTLLDKLLAAGGRYGRDRLSFSGHEPLLEALRAGRGGVLVTAHMGCLELLQGATAWREGLRVSILVHSAHAERFNRIRARLDPSGRLRLLQVEGFSPALAMLLADRVAAGEYVAIAGDRVPLSGDRIVHAHFLGYPAPWPAGPYLLASLLGCPVWMLACMRDRGGYRVQVECLTERVVLPRAGRAQALQEYAQRFSTFVESRLRESPYDWFNFFDFWNQDPNARPPR
jgi:predicted LPLAT superfamily acyltransferase